MGSRTRSHWIITLNHLDKNQIDMAYYIIYIFDSEEDWKGSGECMIQLGRNKRKIYTARLGGLVCFFKMLSPL